MGRGIEREGPGNSLVTGVHVHAVEQHEPKCIMFLIKPGPFALRLSIWLRFGKCLGKSHETWLNRQETNLVAGLKQWSWSW